VDPLKLAIVFERVDPRRGGAETYVADLARALVAAGHSVHLIARDWADGVLPPEVVCTRVHSSGRSLAARVTGFGQKALEALEASNPDASIGLINTWGTDVLIPQGGVHPASLQCNARRYPAGWRRWLYLAAKRLNPRFSIYRCVEARQYDPTRRTWVVAVSHFVEGHLRRFHNVPPDRIRVIPNAIDAARLDVPDPIATRLAFRRDHAIPPEAPLALFVAHNFRLKGLAPLLQALHRRQLDHPTRPPLHLAVCGGGRLAPFRRQVKRLGLAHVVHLIGFVPDVRHAFHASDLFVLPSYYDPCSLVVFEALACGLPVITTACNGAGEVMTQGREGFVVPSPDDIPALAGALEALAHPDTRARMSTAARTLGREQSFHRHVSRLLDLLHDVARSKRETSPASAPGPHPPLHSSQPRKVRS
jgi:UDP-glucose:(heptosyl)LPS alpha-1,3-glucosyltransferase